MSTGECTQFSGCLSQKLALKLLLSLNLLQCNQNYPQPAPLAIGLARVAALADVGGSLAWVLGPRGLWSRFVCRP